MEDYTASNPPTRDASVKCESSFYHTCCSSREMTEPLLPLRLCLWKAAISSVFILRIFCCCSFFISSSYGKDMKIIKSTKSLD